jgi:hypothetical protein
MQLNRIIMRLPGDILRWTALPVCLKTQADLKAVRS